jgi:hypothetical protein
MHEDTKPCRVKRFESLAEQGSYHSRQDIATATCGHTWIPRRVNCLLMTVCDESLVTFEHQYNAAFPGPIIGQITTLSFVQATAPHEPPKLTWMWRQDSRSRLLLPNVRRRSQCVQAVCVKYHRLGNLNKQRAGQPDRLVIMAEPRATGHNVSRLVKHLLDGFASDATELIVGQR